MIILSIRSGLSAYPRYTALTLRKESPRAMRRKCKTRRRNSPARHLDAEMLLQKRRNIMQNFLVTGTLRRAIQSGLEIMKELNISYR